jgi:hypothetical protein
MPLRVFARHGTWWAATVMHLVALGLFLAWLGQSDLFFGHDSGPPLLVIAALVVATVALMATVIWLALRIRGWLGKPETVRLWIAASQMVCAGVLALLSGLIIMVGVTEYPRAQRALRRTRVESLSRQGPAAASALAESQSDDDWAVRQEAARSLGALGPAAQSALPAFERRLAQTAATAEASRYLLALEKISSQAAKDYLTRALRDPDPRVRIQAAHDSWLLDQNPNPVLPVLTAALAGPEKECRKRAAEELAALGASARDAVPALLAATHDDDAQVRLNVARALSNLDG